MKGFETDGFATEVRALGDFRDEYGLEGDEDDVEDEEESEDGSGESDSGSDCGDGCGHAH